MNYSVIRYIIGWVIKLEGLFLLLPSLVGLIYLEPQGWSFFFVSLLCLGIGFFLTGKKPENQLYFAREGFVTVSLSWIVMSLFGSLPFMLSGEISHPVDALFETVSGFTTTGASILSDVEVLSHPSLFWRSFTHWIGGMGVFVFLLTILPMAGGYHMHLMRAESPGPSVGKLVPRLRDTAKILYGIYIVMTLLQIVLLIAVGMPVFDALTASFGTAGTGGFGIKADSFAGYSAVSQMIVTIFMILFGINFNAYYLLLGKHKREIFKMEEVRWYLFLIVGATLIIAFYIRGFYGSVFGALHHAAFQVGSIITTTGYSTADFTLWHPVARSVMALLMFIGACAGSTGGGIKVSRIIILFKLVKQDIHCYIHPRGIKTLRFDGRILDKGTSSGVTGFIGTYLLIFTLSVLLLSLNGFDLETNFTAVASAFNNIGPGLSLVGPMGHFGIFTPFSKLVLIFNMLAGRLELYPVLVLLAPSVWKTKEPGRGNQKRGLL